MKLSILFATILVLLLDASYTQAAIKSTLPTLPAGSAVSAGDLFESRQGSDTSDKKVTSSQMNTYEQGALWGFPLSTTTYPLTHMTGTITNAQYEVAGAILSSMSLGPQALASQNSECYSIAIGPYALNSMAGCDGYYNQGGGIIGRGMHNIAIGPLTMYNLTAANSVAGSGDSGYAVAIGYAALYNATTWSGKIADTTAVGDHALFKVTTGYGNTAIGGDTQGPTTGTVNTLIGAASGGGAMTTATGNEAIGAGAFNNATTGTDNVAIGVSALMSSTTPAGNIAIGSSALASSTTGIGNAVAIGYQALYSTNASLGTNTAIGGFAGQYISTGYQNVAIGNIAMQGSSTTLTTGAANTAIGDTSLASMNGSGAFNTAIGAYAGYLTTATTTGTDNTYIGAGAHGGSATATNETCIGYICGGAGSNTTTIGNTSVTSALINGTLTISAINTGTNADFLCISSGNLVLRQTTACTISSKRFKENIHPFSDIALREIGKLKVVTFTKKAPVDGNLDTDVNAYTPQIGLIAEDVAHIDRKLAIYEQDRITPKSYRQESLIALEAKAIQEQQKEIEQLAPRGILYHRCVSWLPVLCEVER